MITRLGIRTLSTVSQKVFHDVAKQRFMVTVLGAEATLEYSISGRTIELISTTVPEQFQGFGVGKVLAEHAFDHAQKKKLNVVIKCHFLEHYYTKNKAKYEGLNVKIDIQE